MSFRKVLKTQPCHFQQSENSRDSRTRCNEESASLSLTSTPEKNSETEESIQSELTQHTDEEVSEVHELAHPDWFLEDENRSGIGHSMGASDLEGEEVNK